VGGEQRRDQICATKKPSLHTFPQKKKTIKNNLSFFFSFFLSFSLFTLVDFLLGCSNRRTSYIHTYVRAGDMLRAWRR